MDERAKNIIRQSVFRFLLFIDLLMMLSFEISFLCLIKMCLIPYQVSELLLVQVIIIRTCSMIPEHQPAVPLQHLAGIDPRALPTLDLPPSKKVVRRAFFFFLMLDYSTAPGFEFMVAPVSN